MSTFCEKAYLVRVRVRVRVRFGVRVRIRVRVRVRVRVDSKIQSTHDRFVDSRRLRKNRVEQGFRIL